MRGLLPVVVTSFSLAAASPLPAQVQLSALVVLQSAQDRLNFEAGILDSAGGVLFQTIKRLFPAEYEALIKEQMKAAAPHLGDDAALIRAAQGPMTNFWKRKMPDIINAPAPALVAINQGQLNLVRALRKGHVAACAQYVDQGFDGTIALPPALQRQAAGVSILMLEAAKSGRERPRDKSRGALDEGAAVAWMEKFEKVEPSETIRKMLDEDSDSTAATPDQTCQMGIAIHAAIAELPPEQAAKMTAHLLKASMEP